MPDKVDKGLYPLIVLVGKYGSGKECLRCIVSSFSSSMLGVMSKSPCLLRDDLTLSGRESS